MPSRTGQPSVVPQSGAAITGCGVITGLGLDTASFWSGLVNGRSGIRHWLDKDPRIDSKIGGDLSDFHLSGHLAEVGAGYPVDLVRKAKKLLRATPLSGVLTAAAAMQAWIEAGLHESPAPAARCAHVCAGHNLGHAYISENLKTFEEDPEYIEPLFGVHHLDTDVVGVTCELLGIRGPSFMVGAACASGNIAIITALGLIRAGAADVVLVTGAPVAQDSLVLQGLAMIDALCTGTFDDEPERASRPFDALRAGFVPSEGGAAVVLESAASARRRGVAPLATLLGGACTSNAHRLTKPDQNGQERAMLGALATAGIAPDEVDYVNAHATSTPLGDATEVAAIKAVLGARATEIPVNSTKSMTGHCLSASGVVEFVATVLQLRHGVVHPTINQEKQDESLDLDFVPNEAREHRMGVALSNSFGFGGMNSSVAVGAVS
ncbi:beta-ketoacyl synthase [Actinomadura sp. K4S16]|uniref:beta-ketoacyl-[acyl-carrier-protein] synthase family protein n=1 Tax=Actinomadura sp. K4S16 TaxID=1316147 RepID=UPI0011EC4A06|nr:beta-ketoacyl-[acyl-carrier-protein] synthase family protein [Actinomadura sp. K4S16]